MGWLPKAVFNISKLICLRVVWQGVGVACAYAGGIDHHQLDELSYLSGAYKDDFLIGVLFAGALRFNGQNQSEWTDRVCRHYLGFTAVEVGKKTFNIFESTLEKVDVTSDVELQKSYEDVRSSLKREFIRQ